MDGTWSTHGRDEKYCTYILVGETLKKTWPERPSCRWENNVKMDLKEIEYGSVDWIHLA
jgi:hypothetical protein